MAALPRFQPSEVEAKFGRITFDHPARRSRFSQQVGLVGAITGGTVGARNRAVVRIFCKVICLSYCAQHTAIYAAYLQLAVSFAICPAMMYTSWQCAAETHPKNVKHKGLHDDVCNALLPQAHDRRRCLCEILAGNRQRQCANSFQKGSGPAAYLHTGSTHGTRV